MDEKMDIYDDKYSWIGIADKKTVHKEGLWHRVFTCIVVNRETKSIILQKKNAGRYTFDRPDYLDISVGGHYKEGESLEEGVREIKEEMGIDVKYDDLEYLGVRQTSVILADDYINNEFQEIHLLESNIPLDGYNFNEEVGGFVSVPILEGIQLLGGEIEEISAKGIFLKNNRNAFMDLKISRDDFVPNYLKTDKIFLRLFIAANRYLTEQNRNYPLFW